MKDLKILFFSLVMMLGNAPIWAMNGKEYVAPLVEDVIILDNGLEVKGEILKIKKNSFIMNTAEGKVKVANNRVGTVVVGQELSWQERYNLGFLDGKRYAQNGTGNTLVGVFFGFIGAGIVYLTAEQAPSFEAMHGANKTIVNDSAYMAGYEQGSTIRSGNRALIGAAIGSAVALIIILASSGGYDYYYY